MNTKHRIILSAILFNSASLAKPAEFILIGMMTTNTAQVNYMEDQSHSGIRIWSQETNGLRIGLISGNPQLNSLEERQAFFGVVVTNCTSNRLSFVVPKIPLQFNLSLLDERGNPVSRTWGERNIGKTIPAIKTFTHDELINNEYDIQTEGREFLSPGELELFTCVNLFDYFKIKEPGRYRVEYEQRFQTVIVQSNQPPVLTGLVWPKAIITINIQ
jgi:hypothetical protein